MKKFLILFVLILFTFTAVMAQSDNAEAAAKGGSFSTQSLNGSTGLYSIPSGRIGWENGGLFAMDFGYRAIINNKRAAHIPAVTISLIRWIEISTSLDIQPDATKYQGDYNDDLLIGFKVRLPSTKNTGLVIGMNLQFIDLAHDELWYDAYQPYIAFTYSGSFFSMPADTTLMFGKTFYRHNRGNNTNFDFGMGVDLNIFPKLMGNFFHLVIDFSNIGYSDDAWPNHNRTSTTASVWRGVFNAGLRLNFSAIPAMKKVKFGLDFAFNDLLDAGQRSFTAGGVIGFTI